MSKAEMLGALITFVVALGWVGSSDMEDQIAQDDLYVDMVCDGKWPDYKNLQPECK